MSKRGTEIRLATRGSDLALRQAGEVEAALADRRFEVDLVTVETAGDQVRDELIHRLGKTGAFVRSLDEKVLAGEVDAAVHSMKDVPTEGGDDLVVAAIPERASANDVLVTPDGASLDDLPSGATVGTSSLRRRAQLLHHRPDLTVEPLRGNVDTRVEKLLAPALRREHEERTEAEREAQRASDRSSGDEPRDAEREAQRASDRSSGDEPRDVEREEKAHAGDDDPDTKFEQSVEEWFDGLAEIERRALEREVETEYDAVVLAGAGLERSGLAHHLDYAELPTDEFVPAPGQGALAVTAPDGDLAEDLHAALDHPRTRVETTVERTILAELGGGCVAPIGVHALIQGEYVHVDVQVFSGDGEEVIEADRDLPVETHAAAATDFAADLADRGAADLIAAARDDAEGDGGDDPPAEGKRGESVHGTEDGGR